MNQVVNFIGRFKIHLYLSWSVTFGLSSKVLGVFISYIMDCTSALVAHKYRITPSLDSHIGT